MPAPFLLLFLNNFLLHLFVSLFLFSINLSSSDLFWVYRWKKQIRFEDRNWWRTGLTDSFGSMVKGSHDGTVHSSLSLSSYPLSISWGTILILYRSPIDKKGIINRKEFGKPKRILGRDGKHKEKVSTDQTHHPMPVSCIPDHWHLISRLSIFTWRESIMSYVLCGRKI